MENGLGETSPSEQGGQPGEEGNVETGRGAGLDPRRALHLPAGGLARIGETEVAMRGNHSLFRVCSSKDINLDLTELDSI